MKLRQWQAECAQKVISTFNQGKNNFFCLATPGAGKSIMAAEVGKRLIENDQIEFIICFAPSINICEGLKRTFTSHLNRSFNGLLGSIGQSLTYQSMLHQQDEFWEIINSNRVLVVFDEIHHCEGISPTLSNSWGFKILEKIKAQANYTLCLSGTPWRSNNSPIVLGKYVEPDYELECDYIYGFKQAIKDNICRNPRIVLIDNDRISVGKEKESFEDYHSVKELLRKSNHPYQAILRNHLALKELLSRANKKLNEIRAFNSNAAGLIVASSVDHAKDICRILSTMGEATVMVSYKNNDAARVINSFRTDTEKWIVSIGMISEGTDIPRLQVCCHLSRVKTELHFRQVLGRILRKSNEVNQEAWLYTFAEEKLTKFSLRLESEIPENAVVTTEKIDCFNLQKPSSEVSSLGNQSEIQLNELPLELSFDSPFIGDPPSIYEETHQLNSDLPVEFLGIFREQVIETFISPF